MFLLMQRLSSSIVALRGVRNVLVDARNVQVRAMGCSTSKMGGGDGDAAQKGGEKEDKVVEAVVCRDEDIGENEMKAFDVDGAGKVLIVRQNGRLSALGAHCTHYGAPLEKGALGNGRVRCPWHGACFNILTGDIEDFPGLDSLPCHEVRVENSEIKVRTKLDTKKRLKTLSCRSESNKEHMVVIGGGPAGATCVETLRQEGFTGQLTLVAKENCLPYDRIKLSKTLDIPVENLEFRNEDYYKNGHINVLKNVAAERLDLKGQTVHLSDGTSLSYTKVFVATGSTARKLPVTGGDLKNVFVLREHVDGKAIQAQLSSSSNVVVLGSSFIAMEVAAYCTGKVASVTVVNRGSLPFQPLLGPEIGQAVRRLYEEKGVKFVDKAETTSLLGNSSGEVTTVKLNNGQQLDADVVIAGIGTTLNTQLLKESGFELLKNGAVEVDEHMRTSDEDVFAGGDIAHAPVHAANLKTSIGHIGLAQLHGRIAALNMLNKTTPLRNVPFFWTMFFGKSIRYAGHGRYNEIVYAGSVDDFKFIAHYLNGDRVVAVATCGMDPAAAQYAEIIGGGRELRRSDLGDDNMAWTK